MYANFSSLYSKIFPFSQETYDFLEKYANIQGNILDLGCGDGQYAGAFLKKNIKVYGADIDISMIEIARKNYPEGIFFEKGIEDDSLFQRKYSTIFCIGNSFAHVKYKDVYIKNIYKSLVTDGIWIVQIMNWDAILRKESFFFGDIKIDAMTFSRRYENISEEKIQFHTQLKNDQGILSEGFVSLYPKRTEIFLQEHEKIGFHLKKHCYNFQENPADEKEFSANIFVFQKK